MRLPDYERGMSRRSFLKRAGLSGLVAGVEQVNVRISEQAATGAAVPLNVRVGQTFAGSVTIAVE